MAQRIRSGVILFAFVIAIGWILAIMNPLRVAHPQSSNSCGLQAPAFCDPLNVAAGNGNRSGPLNGVAWGVSRNSSAMIPGQGQYDGWYAASASECNTSPAFPPNDLQICNGHLAETHNDGGTEGGGNQDIFALYPKQPFDIAGRLARVTFDVGADSEGHHAAWPDFELTDQPVPGPGEHASGQAPDPRNSFGFSIAPTCQLGQQCGQCTGGTSIDQAWMTAGYVYTDLTSNLTPVACVAKGSPTALNHFEVDFLPCGCEVDVYGTAPGTAGPLVLIAKIAGFQMPLTRGLIWIEDVHYNGCKFGSGTQCNHEFAWANVGFDGPVLPRDLTFDVLDNTKQDSSVRRSLGWRCMHDTGCTNSWEIPGAPLQTVPVTNVGQASAALLTLNWAPQNSDTITWSLNGHADHVQPWPFPDAESSVVRTIAFPVPLSEVVSGPNSINIKTSDDTAVAQVDLILVGAGGVVPCNCGGGTPVPTATASASATTRPTSTPSPTAQPTQTSTPAPSATPTVTAVPTATATPSPTATPAAVCKQAFFLNDVLKEGSVIPCP